MLEERAAEGCEYYKKKTWKCASTFAAHLIGSKRVEETGQVSLVDRPSKVQLWHSRSKGIGVLVGGVCGSVSCQRKLRANPQPLDRGLDLQTFQFYNMHADGAFTNDDFLSCDFVSGYCSTSYDSRPKTHSCNNNKSDAC